MRVFVLPHEQVFTSFNDTFTVKTLKMYDLFQGRNGLRLPIALRFVFVVFIHYCDGFKVYWNIPTKICWARFNMDFSVASKNFSFTQNTDDYFRGDRIASLHNPGFFPRVINADDLDMLKIDWPSLQYINGGIPQEGNIDDHLKELEMQVKLDIPNSSFSGLAVIHMEQWGATWAQNSGKQEIYQRLSVNYTEKQHPDWRFDDILEVAKTDYEKMARLFMRKSLKFCKSLRPNATWGYFKYPQCFHKPTDHHGSGWCSEGNKLDNNNMLWLWTVSDALFPYISLTEGDMTEKERAIKIRSTVREALRIVKFSKRKLPVYVYTWYKYEEYKRGIMSDEDMENILKISKEEGADGVIVLGKYMDFTTKAKCTDVYTYLQTSLGPIVKKVLELPHKQTTA